MNILFVSDHYPPYIKGGAAVSTSLLAQWLSHRKDTVSVACSKLADQSWVDHEVTVYPILFKPSGCSRNFFSAVWYGCAIIFYQAISTLRVLKLMRDLKPDIVNVVPADYRCIPIIVGIRLFSKCPVVVDCRDYSLVCPAHLSATYLGKKKSFNEETQSHHGYRCIGYTSANDFSFLSIRPFALYEAGMFKLYTSCLRFLVNHSSGITLVGVSKYVRGQLILNGFKLENTTAIYNISKIIAERSPVVPSEVPMFAYGGRIEEDKGIWDLVSAVELLKHQSEKPFLVKIAGTGTEFNKLQTYITEHGLDCIVLLGHIPPDEILSLYEQSLAIIGHSRIPEPFGRFILESMSVGKPIIATRTGGMIEVIEDGATGLLVDIGDPKQLASAMSYFIENPERSKAMEEKISEQQKYYRADYIGSQRVALYESILGNSTQ